MPDNPTSVVMGHPFHGQGLGAAGEALLGSGAQPLAVCSGTTGNFQAYPGLWWLVTILHSRSNELLVGSIIVRIRLMQLSEFYPVCYCCGDSWIISRWMSVFDCTFIWTISKTIYKRGLFLSSDFQCFTQCSHGMGTVCLFVTKRTRLGTAVCLTVDAQETSSPKWNITESKNGSGGKGP